MAVSPDTVAGPRPETVADLGRKVKRKYPVYSRMSDVELGRKIRAKYPAYRRYVDVPDEPVAAPAAPAAPDYAPTTQFEPVADPRRQIAETRARVDTRPEFVRGFMGGLTGQNVEGSGRMLEATAEMTPLSGPGPGGMPGPLAGAAQLARRAGGALRRAGAARIEQPKVPSFTEVRSARDLFDYLQFQAGQGIASTVPSVVSGTAGALIGGSVAGPAGAAVGATAGAVTTSYPLNFGDVAAEVEEAMPTATPLQRAQIAAVISIPVTALDVASVGKVVDKVSKRLMIRSVIQEAARRGLLSRILLSGGLQGGVEAATEATQEIIQAISVAQASGKELTPKQMAVRAVDAGIAGLLTGGVLGGAAEAIPQRTRPADDGGGTPATLEEEGTGTTRLRVKPPPTAPGAGAGPTTPGTGPRTPPAGPGAVPAGPQTGPTPLSPSITEAAAIRENLRPPPEMTGPRALSGRQMTQDLMATLTSAQQRAGAAGQTVSFSLGDVSIEDAYIVPELVRMFPGSPEPVRVTVYDKRTGRLHSFSLPSITALRGAFTVESAAPAGPISEAQPGPRISEAEQVARGVVEPYRELPVERAQREKVADIKGRIATLESQVAKRPGDKRVGKWRRRIATLRAQLPVQGPATVISPSTRKETPKVLARPDAPTEESAKPAPPPIPGAAPPSGPQTPVAGRPQPPAAPAPSTTGLVEHFSDMGKGISHGLDEMIYKAASTGRHPALGTDVSKWPPAERAARAAFLAGATKEAVIRAGRESGGPQPQGGATAGQRPAPAAPTAGKRVRIKGVVDKRFDGRTGTVIRTVSTTSAQGTGSAVEVRLDDGTVRTFGREEVVSGEAQPAVTAQPGAPAPDVGVAGEPRRRGDTREGRREQTGHEKIALAREEFTSRADESRVPEDLRQHLMPHQLQGVAKADASMNERGGFLLADGTGVGKTREILAIAAMWLKRGHRVAILAPNEVYGKPWDPRTMKSTGGRARVVGSYADDAKTMGINTKLWRAKDGTFPSSGIVLTTYENIHDVPVDENTVYIFDESHALKNAGTGGKNSRAAAGVKLANAGKAVLFASATPADKPLHIEYLRRIGILEGKSLDTAVEALGFRRTTKPDGKVYWTPLKVWRYDAKKGHEGHFPIRTEEILKRMSALFDRMTKLGSTIKREVSMDEVTVQFRRIKMPKVVHDAMNKIADAFDSDNPFMYAQMLMHQRRQQEPYKARLAVEIAKKEIAEGRQVVIFVARVNRSDVNVTIGFDRSTGEKITETIMSSEGTAKELAALLKAEGIPFAELHGAADTHASEAMDVFQSKKVKVLVATIESGGTGINLDDRVGDAPRTQIVVTAPFGGVPNVQAAGRINRLTTKSPSRIIYLFGDTSVDDWNAAIIASKMKTLGATVAGDVRKLDPGIDPDMLDEQTLSPEEAKALLGEEIGDIPAPPPEEVEARPPPEPAPEPAPATRGEVPERGGKGAARAALNVTLLPGSSEQKAEEKADWAAKAIEKALREMREEQARGAPKPVPAEERRAEARVSEDDFATSLVELWRKAKGSAKGQVINDLRKKLRNEAGDDRFLAVAATKALQIIESLPARKGRRPKDAGEAAFTALFKEADRKKVGGGYKSSAADQFVWQGKDGTAMEGVKIRTTVRLREPLEHFTTSSNARLKGPHFKHGHYIDVEIVSGSPDAAEIGRLVSEADSKGREVVVRQKGGKEALATVPAKRAPKERKPSKKQLEAEERGRQYAAQEEAENRAQLARAERLESGGPLTDLEKREIKIEGWTEEEYRKYESMNDRWKLHNIDFLKGRTEEERERAEAEMDELRDRVEARRERAEKPVPEIQVEQSRLEWEGDIAKAYSADIMSEKGSKIRKPVEINGKLWTVDGISHFGTKGGDRASLWSLTPLDQWKGETYSGHEIHKRWDEFYQRRGDKRGQLVYYGKNAYVLTDEMDAVGPEKAPEPNKPRKGTPKEPADLSKLTDEEFEDLFEGSDEPEDFERLALEAQRRGLGYYEHGVYVPKESADVELAFKKGDKVRVSGKAGRTGTIVYNTFPGSPLSIEVQIDGGGRRSFKADQLTIIQRAPGARGWRDVRKEYEAKREQKKGKKKPGPQDATPAVLAFRSNDKAKLQTALRRTTFADLAVEIRPAKDKLPATVIVTVPVMEPENGFGLHHLIEGMQDQGFAPGGGYFAEGGLVMLFYEAGSYGGMTPYPPNMPPGAQRFTAAMVRDEGGPLEQPELGGEVSEDFALTTQEGRAAPSGRSFIEEFEDLSRQGASLEDATEQAGERSGQKPPAGVDLQARWSRVRREAQEAAGQVDMFGGAAMLGSTEPTAPTAAPEREAAPRVGEAAPRAEKPSEATVVPLEGLWYWQGFQNREVARGTPPTQNPGELVNAAHVRMLTEEKGGFDIDEVVRRPILVWRDEKGELGEAGRRYVIDGHHRSYMAREAGAKRLPAVQVFGDLAYARSQARLANMASVPNTLSEQARIARELRERGDPWDRVAAQIRMRESRAKALVDFAHLDPGVRADYFPSGNEAALFGGTTHGEAVGRYAREHPDVMTPSVQRQWLDQAKNDDMRPTVFTETLRKWVSAMKAAKQEVMELGGVKATKLVMTPKQFAETSGRLIGAFDAARQSVRQIEKSLEEVSKLAGAEENKAVLRFTRDKLAEVTAQAKKLKKAKDQIEADIHEALVAGMKGEKDLAASLDEIQKKVDEILGGPPPRNPILGEGGFIAIPELLDAIVKALKRLVGLARRRESVREAQERANRELIDSLIDEIQKAIKAAGPIRERQERSYTRERGERRAMSRVLERGKQGMARHRARQRAMAGRYRKIAFDSIAKAFSQEKIDRLVEMIYSHPALDFFEQRRATDALEKLLGEMGGEIPQRNELELLEIVFGTKLVEELVKARPQIVTMRQALFSLGSITKTMRTAYDLSAPLRQGLFLLPTYPKQWAKAFGDMHRYWLSEEAFRDSQHEIWHRKNARLYRKIGLSLTRPGSATDILANEELFLGARFLQRVPGVRRSERAYSGFLNKLRADVFDLLMEAMIGQGSADPSVELEEDATPQQVAAMKQATERARKLAKFVNAATGRGDADYIKKNAHLLNFVFFSPQLFQSRLHLLGEGVKTADILTGGHRPGIRADAIQRMRELRNPFTYVKADPFVRRQYQRAWANFAGAATVMLTLAAWAGASVEWDKLNADWGKIRVGNNVYDILGGFVQYLRFFPDLADALIDQHIGRKRKYGETALDVAGRFGEHKVSPFVAYALGAARGWKYGVHGRERFDKGEEFAKLFLPMIAEDTWRTMQTDPRQLPAAVPAANYGVSVQHYPRPKQ